jgi:pimeloyl-ACP methyl ester carboxylesterase
MTETAIPYFREAGNGPGVVCLHSNASSSSQWRELIEALAPTHRVLAADGWSAGRSPAWPHERAVTLDDEVALLEPVFERAGAPFTLVGHSYGAAVALAAAASWPARVRALVLYEPTLFALLDAAAPPPNEADGIRAAVAASVAALEAGDPDRAAECFIDYWMGAGSWARMPAARRGPIAASIVNVRHWAAALFGEARRLAAFAALEMPVLYLVGRDSTVSARGVARLLTAALPRVDVVELEGVGHMGPITHPQRVNEAIVRFLERV